MLIATEMVHGDTIVAAVRVQVERSPFGRNGFWRPHPILALRVNEVGQVAADINKAKTQKAGMLY